MHHAVAAILTVIAIAATGCSSTPDEPGITCNDGYVAQPTYTQDRDGCGPHGGVVDPSKDALDTYLDTLPTGQPTAYVCHDGWRSTAIGNQGACSSHDGIALEAYPDGSHVVLDGPQKGSVIRPDGSTMQPYKP